MPGLRSIFTSALQHLPTHHQRPQQYTAPISTTDLPAEYLLIEISEDLSSDGEAAVATLLTETHRNGLTTGLTDTEGYPSLFPPGASLFETNDSGSRLQDILSVLDRFTHVFHRQETDVIVLNTARIEENIRIAEQDPGQSGLIAQQNIDALAVCLNTLSEEQYRFVNSDAVPASSRDGHLVKFREAILYR